MDYSVKIISQDDESATVGGFGVVFGGLDLEGEYFTRNTDFMLDLVPSKPVLYDHALQKGIGHFLGAIPAGGIRVEDKGLWVEAQLKRSADYVDEVLKLVERGVLGWSSGTIGHLARRSKGEITQWPLVEFSLTPTPAEPRTLGVERIKALADAYPDLKALILKTDDPEAEQDTAAVAVTESATAPGRGEAIKNKNLKEPKKMDEDVKSVVAEAVAAAMKEEKEKRAADAEAQAKQAEREKEIAENAIKEYQKSFPVEDKFGVANVAKHGDVWKYDNYPAGDLAAALEYVSTAKGITPRQSNPLMVKALALRLESDESKDESERTVLGGHAVKIAGPLKVAKQHMKAVGIKADETNFSTNANFGDEWIGVAYGGELWDKVRENSTIVQRVPSFEFPQGAESMVIPLTATDPVWYVVAQAGDPTSGTAQVANTVTAKALGSSNVTMTLGKLGSSTIYTGEMVEDSMVPFVSALRAQIALSGADYLTSAIVDGDTEAGASTNINDIAGTPAATDWFMVWNGFRKSCLVTTTANSRDGGVLTSADFIETVKLMGAAGKTGFNRRSVSFIIDPHVHWKALELADVKTRDVFANATIEGGLLNSIYGYEVIPSFEMHLASLVNTGYEYKTNAAGKIDIDTASNNTKGVILAVRWDHWRLGNKRRLTTEVERIPRADAWEITSILRAGLKQRDTEASAITYNLTV